MHHRRPPFRALAGLLAGAATLGLAACHGGGHEASYMVTLTNLTHAQPLSPAAVVVHADGWHAWTVGDPAGEGVERLAEGGDNGALLGEATAAGAVTAALDGALVPGASASVLVEVDGRSRHRLTVAGMLVATNDGFAGLDAVDLAPLARGEAATWEVPVWDAGSEANDEAAATVPALGGTGYDAARDDIADRVTGHPGVVSADDGLATSGLDAGHRFDNPALRVTVVRL